MIELNFSKKILNEFRQGVLAGIPIAIGYIPISVAFGVVAKQTGIPLIQSVLMSSLVFAGASQFMAVNMLAQGSGVIEIILATFVLNFRQFIMSLSLMNILEETTGIWKSILSLGITDEIFAVASLQKEKANHLFLAGLTITAYAAWVIGTILGGLLSNVIPTSISSDMSIALYAMFIGLLVPAIRGTWKIGLVAAISMLLNSMFGMFISNGWSIVFATLLGGLIGAIFIRGDKNDK